MTGASALVGLAAVTLLSALLVRPEPRIDRDRAHGLVHGMGERQTPTIEPSMAALAIGLEPLRSLNR